MQNAAWMVLGLGFFILIGALWYLGGHSTATVTEPHESATGTLPMIVRSPAFNHEETVPGKYTCDGEDISPPLAIDNIPAGTQSLVLIMDDPDAPGRVWDHWVVYNMPATTTRIGEGEAPEGVPGNNSWGRMGYGGPCPPDGEHRYLFKVYALNTTLTVHEGATKQDVLAALAGHILESATLMGRYKRPD